MPRWEPHAANRLEQAALELFAERGYEDTTVVDIAARAGLGKTTFFRHYQDKREVLFGDGSVEQVLVAAVTGAPAHATPIEAVARAFDALGEVVYIPERRAFIAGRRGVIDANPELREREALKDREVSLMMISALRRRGVPEVRARVVADFAAIAAALAQEKWMRGSNDDFAAIARRALQSVRKTAVTV